MLNRTTLVNGAVYGIIAVLAYSVWRWIVVATLVINHREEVGLFIREVCFFAAAIQLHGLDASVALDEHGNLAMSPEQVQALMVHEDAIQQTANQLTAGVLLGAIVTVPVVAIIGAHLVRWLLRKTI